MLFEDTFGWQAREPTIGNNMVSTLFNRLGGEDAVLAAVTLFYEKVLANDHISPFFAGLDMEKQIDKQIAFMTMAFEGPNNYTAKDLAVAHAPLLLRGLDDTHFDAIVRLLGESLFELEVDQTMVDEVLGVVEATREAVMGRAK